MVAPCTMNCMAKLAAGLCDDVVTLILSAIDRTKTPVILAPAMNAQMWGQPSTQRNLATLHADGYHLIGPAEGWQACRTSGPGRMNEPEELFDAHWLCRGDRAGPLIDFNPKSGHSATLHPPGRLGRTTSTGLRTGLRVKCQPRLPGVFVRSLDRRES